MDQKFEIIESVENGAFLTYELIETYSELAEPDKIAFINQLILLLEKTNSQSWPIKAFRIIEVFENVDDEDTAIRSLGCILCRDYISLPYDPLSWSNRAKTIAMNRLIEINTEKARFMLYMGELSGYSDYYGKFDSFYSKSFSCFESELFNFCENGNNRQKTKALELLADSDSKAVEEFLINLIDSKKPRYEGTILSILKNHKSQAVQLKANERLMQIEEESSKEKNISKQPKEVIEPPKIQKEFIPGLIYAAYTHKFDLPGANPYQGSFSTFQSKHDLLICLLNILNENIEPIINLSDDYDEDEDEDEVEEDESFDEDGGAMESNPESSNSSAQKEFNEAYSYIKEISEREDLELMDLIGFGVDIGCFTVSVEAASSWPEALNDITTALEGIDDLGLDDFDPDNFDEYEDFDLQNNYNKLKRLTAESDEKDFAAIFQEIADDISNMATF